MLKEWEELRKRSIEITPESRFMDVIAQVRGGFSEDGVSDDDGFLSFTQSEDVHMIVQEWINLVYPFLIEFDLKEAQSMAQDMTNTVINTPSHLRKIWTSLRGKVQTG